MFKDKPLINQGPKTLENLNRAILRLDESRNNTSSIINKTGLMDFFIFFFLFIFYFFDKNII